MSAPRLLDIARAYWHAGLCPLPRVSGHVEPSYVDPDGVIQSIPWGAYTVKQPDWATVAAWFARSDLATVGMLLLPGSHAHPRAARTAFLQILDVESAAMWEQLQEACTSSGHAAMLSRWVIEPTPSGGVHLGFLCPAIGDTQKLILARRQAGHKILIELLQHQCCTIPPTAIRCQPAHPGGGPSRLLPWWHDLFTRHGWREVSRSGLAAQGLTYWPRPGKGGNQPSATLGACGPSFYCFTATGAPFAPGRAYSPFAAYALLEHGGDFAQAAKVVAHQLGLAPQTAPRRVVPCLTVPVTRRIG